MSKLCVFDLDGVLVDTKDIHYDTLNEAIALIAGEDYTITLPEHHSTYDGLSTMMKLEMLVRNKGLPPEHIKPISDMKKVLTRQSLNTKIGRNKKLVDLFKKLREDGHQIAVASNAIRETVVTCLCNLGVMPFVDYFQSNEDVRNKKPHPEIYWNCMAALHRSPKETIIVEDSAVGREGASQSGATLLAIQSPDDLTYDKLAPYLSEHYQMKKVAWVDHNMNVLIPMAGAGSRFADQGYTFPKPLIEVRGKPMIQVVVENLGIEANYIYIVQKAHYEKYNLQHLMNLITPNCTIIQTDGLTEGAACTTLLAKDYINNNKRLVIANSDQFVEWNSNEVLYSLIESGLDGGILTFKSTHPKWSFARLDRDGFVIEVAEKKPISDNATVGVYYWKHGVDYVSAAEDMIAKNIRVNNEFYVAPVFNQAIEAGKKIGIREVSNMWGIGVPEDLKYFLDNYKGKL